MEIAAGDRLTLAMGRWDRHAENTLYSHCVATRSTIGKEAAGAAPVPFMESRGIRIIFAAERCFEVIELDAIRLFRITFCLRNFADHARMHGAHLLGRLVGYTVNMYIF